jgi:hypothetical protein
MLMRSQVDRDLFAGGNRDERRVRGVERIDSSWLFTSSDVSKQLPQSTVDAWNVTFSAAKLAKSAQDTGWQPASPNPWPAEASPSNAQHGGSDAALAPRNAQPSTGDAGSVDRHGAFEVDAQRTRQAVQASR